VRRTTLDLWTAWARKAAAAIVDLGSPLERVASLGGSASPGHVGGFSVLQGASVEDVKRQLDGHPHFKMPGGSIEIFEFLSMPGM
jgi:hypothetical protein